MKIIDWKSLLGHRILTRVTETCPGDEKNIGLTVYLQEIEICAHTKDGTQVQFRKPYDIGGAMWTDASMKCLRVGLRNGGVQVYEFIEDVTKEEKED